jgi:hypothetical protein
MRSFVRLVISKIDHIRMWEFVAVCFHTQLEGLEETAQEKARKSCNSK